MEKLPQRPRSHVLETESRIFVQQILPAEWIIREINSDYGVDLEVEIVNNGIVTGAHFLIQLKSSETLTINKKGFIAHPCKTTALQYYLERSELVIYLIYDATKKKGYWIWVQEFLTNQSSQTWKSQKEFTVQISSNSIFDKDAIQKIKKRVLQTHGKDKIIRRVQSLNSHNFKYDLSFNDDLTTIKILPNAHPTKKIEKAAVKLDFNFDNSIEGKKALSEWRNFIKKGVSAKIDARFIERINTDPSLNLKNILGEDFKVSNIEIEPLKSGVEFPAKIEILDDKNNLLTKWNYIDFEEIRRGTEEGVFSNEKQNSTLTFSLILNYQERSCKIRCSPSLQGHTIVDVRQALYFQKNFAQGTTLHLVDLKTDNTILKFSIAESKFYAPSMEIISLVDKIFFLQEKFSTNFIWPQKITEEDVYLVEDLIKIVTTGETFEGNSFEFPIDKVSAQALANQLASGTLSKIALDGKQDRILLIFDKEINLGKVRVFLPKIVPNYETIKIFEALDSWPDKKPVNIGFAVSNPGVIVQYRNWFQEEKGD